MSKRNQAGKDKKLVKGKRKREARKVGEQDEANERKKPGKET